MTHHDTELRPDTLVRQLGRFVAAADTLAGLGFDENFQRKWLFYLDYCAAGFRTGLIDVRQLVYTRS